METVFRLHPSEMDDRFIAAIKKLFGKREIEITVTAVPDDGTAYLLGNESNRAHLMEALDEAKEGRNLVRFSGEEFDAFNKGLLG